jgi:hypothetical protein
MRQMRVEVERGHPLEEPQAVERGVDFDGRRRSVGLGSGMQPEPVFHRNAKSGQERAREAAEALLRRDGPIPVMEKLRERKILPIVVRKPLGLADVVMGADEGEVARDREERADGIHFGGARLLPGTQRIEADDDERVDRLEEPLVEGTAATVAALALDLVHRVARRRAGQSDEIHEVLVQ